MRFIVVVSFEFSVLVISKHEGVYGFGGRKPGRVSGVESDDFGDEPVDVESSETGDHIWR